MNRPGTPMVIAKSASDDVDPMGHDFAGHSVASRLAGDSDLKCYSKRKES
jgi:hypothetical protein